MSLGGTDGATSGLEGLEFPHEYSMQSSHMDDLNAFYASHPGLVNAGDIRHDKQLGGMAQHQDMNTQLPMGLNSDMLNANDLLNQHRLGPEQLANPQFESMLHERLMQMRDNGHDVDALLQRSQQPEQRNDLPMGYQHADEFHTEAPNVPKTPGRGHEAAHQQQGLKEDGRQGSMAPIGAAHAYGPYQHQKGFHPLDATAITPASVFSTISSASTNDFLSPITSPALQPQGSQGMYSTGDPDQIFLQQDMLSTMSSPSHPNVRVPFPGGNAQNAYSRGMYAHSEMHNMPGDTSVSASERTANAVRRNRSTTAESKANKVRPSPLMKPTQSPKVAPGSGNTPVWQANNVAQLRKRESSNSSTSPSLGALETLSSTMQEASGLSMPSPALSPALMAMGQTGAVTPRSAPHTRSSSLTRRPRSRLGDEPGTPNPGTAGSTRHNSISDAAEADNSPSPIDLANQEGQAPSQRPTKPVTPGTIMGIQQSTSPQEHNPEQWVQLEQSGENAPSVPNHSVSPNNFSSFGYAPSNEISGMGSFPTQNAAVNAVAASALINASQPRPSMFYQGTQPKPILPGGLSSEDRNAWMNLRRVGNGGLDQRRTSHKAAEQKRRDSLKHCFDELRGLLPAITLDESVSCGSILGPDGSSEDQLAEGFDPETTKRPRDGEAEPLQEGARPPLYVVTPEQARDANRAIAKVLLLRHSNEYLVRLKRRIERRDTALQSLSQEVVRLRNALAEAKGDSKPDASSVSHNFNSLTLAQSQKGEARAQDGGQAQSVDTPGSMATPAHKMDLA